MNYRKGSIIEYKTFDGTHRKVLVSEKVDNIKNNRSGFDGVIVGDGRGDYTVWGYDHQITRVVVR